jgi:hypothetical protein
MIRRFCAWWLVLLALSPFTAPFPTCDLPTLLGRQTAHVRILQRVDHASLTENEAPRVSPLVERSVPDKLLVEANDASSWTLVTPAELTADRYVLTIRSPNPLRESPPEYVAQTTVLRL